MRIKLDRYADNKNVQCENWLRRLWKYLNSAKAAERIFRNKQLLSFSPIFAHFFISVSGATFNKAEILGYAFAS